MVDMESTVIVPGSMAFPTMACLAVYHQLAGYFVVDHLELLAFHRGFFVCNE